MTIEECWEKHGHLDYLLSDYEWITASDDVRFLILFDCWQAIRDAAQKNLTPTQESS